MRFVSQSTKEKYQSSCLIVVSLDGAVCDPEWRPAWTQAMDVIQTFKVTTILMSATLPTDYMDQVWKAFHLTGEEEFCQVIRSPSTHVPNITHQIAYMGLKPKELYNLKKEDRLSLMVELIVPVIQQAVRHLPRDEDRIIVFCNYRDAAEAYASALGSLPAIYGDVDRRTRQETFSRFTDPNGSDRVIVMNKAGFYGFNYPHIRAVLHVQPSLNLMDYVQASGRGGRDELQLDALSLTILPFSKGYYTGELRVVEPDFVGSEYIPDMNKSRKCSRLDQGKHLDGISRSCRDVLKLFGELDVKDGRRAGNRQVMLCSYCLQDQGGLEWAGRCFSEDLGLNSEKLL